MSRMESKVAIVTGGGQGIGKAICDRLAEEGAAVVVAEMNEQTGKAAAREIQERGGRALFVDTDVGDEASAKQAVATAVDEFGGLDVLVNNAAIFVLKNIDDATVDDWQGILRVNVLGAALMAKHAAKPMRRRGGGAIVNLGSISSFIAQPDFVPYNTSKAAVANMTRCLALDLAADGIRVNAVCPGTVWTPIVERMAQEMGLTREEAETHPDFGGAHMIERLATPREIANAVLFLASSEASFITGECLMVDGGYTAK